MSRRLLPYAVGSGCLVAICLVAAATWNAPLREHSPIQPPGTWGRIYLAAVVASFILYVAGVWIVRRRRVSLLAIVALAIAIQVAPLAGPLIGSTDVYAYWGLGRVAAVHDGNPYVNPPSEWPNDAAFSLIGEQWRSQTSTYGPLWTGASTGIAEVAGDSSGRASFLFRALAGLGSVALILAAVWLAVPNRRAFAAVFIGWNPVLAMQFAGGGHNDTLMMALPIAGMAVAAQGRRNLGAALWPLAVVIKWLPLIFLPLLAARDRKQFGWTGLALIGAATALVSTALYGTHWIGAASPIADQIRRTGSTSIPHYADKWLGLPDYRVTQGLLVLFAGAYVLLLRQAWNGRARLGLTAGLFCVSLAWLTPWYVAWPVSLSAVEEDKAAWWIAIGLTGWLLRDAVVLH